jgi:hypothetical protein
MTRTLLVVVIAALYVLHQDFFFWKTARIFGVIPFGFIPIGLFYHACFSVAASLVMWLLVRYAWPSHLEQEIEQAQSEEGSGS